MNTTGVLINHPSELNSLLVARPFRKPGRGTIRLAPEFTHPERDRWEASINRHYYACGCSGSAKGLLLMLVLGAGAGVGAYLLDALSFSQAAALPIAAAVSGALIGKLWGLSAARRQLMRVVHTVQANWKPEDKVERPIVVCG